MVYLELDEVLAIACEVLGLEVDALVRVTDLGLADSAVARPRASFGGEEFYPSIEAKAASLLFGLARNHAFIDGNKRIAVLSTLGHCSNLFTLQKSRQVRTPRQPSSSESLPRLERPNDLRLRHICL